VGQTPGLALGLAILVWPPSRAPTARCSSGPLDGPEPSLPLDPSATV